MLPVDENYIDGKRHSDGVNRLRGDNEQPAPRLKRPRTQQADHSPKTGVGDSDLLSEARTSGRIVDTSHLAIRNQTVCFALPPSRAALSALDQDKQHHYKQNARDYADHRYGIHEFALLLIWFPQQACVGLLGLSNLER